MVMQHTSPLEKRRKRGDYLYQTGVNTVLYAAKYPKTESKQKTEESFKL